MKETIIPSKKPPIRKTKAMKKKKTVEAGVELKRPMMKKIKAGGTESKAGVSQERCFKVLSLTMSLFVISYLSMSLTDASFSTYFMLSDSE